MKPWEYLLETDADVRRAETAWKSSPSKRTFLKLRRLLERENRTDDVRRLRDEFIAWRARNAEKVTRANVEDVCKRGCTFYHITARNADGTPLRCRVNASKVKLWKRQPSNFRLPVKYGLRDCFYLTPENSHEWTLDDNWFTDPLPGDS